MYQPACSEYVQAKLRVLESPPTFTQVHLATLGTTLYIYPLPECITHVT